MVLPLVAAVWAASALIGAWGARESYLATDAWTDAARSRDGAAQRLKEAIHRYEEERDRTNALLGDLGQRRLDAAAGELERGIRIIEAVHDVRRGNRPRAGRALVLPEVSVVKMRQTAVTAFEIVKGGGLAAAGGAAGVMGALGLATTVGTASTGTAIASLSGAAATNATLAWLGGGALSAGGFGMAGGTLALTGVFTGPVIGVAGFAARAAAERDRTAAEEDVTATAEALAAIDVVIVDLGHLNARVTEFAAILATVAVAIARLCARLGIALSRHGWAGGESMATKVPYSKLSVAEQADYQSLIVGIRALHQLIEIDVIDEFGRPSAASAAAIHKAREFEEKEDT